jgi:L-threonylcarbamoyladenylate synthase
MQVIAVDAREPEREPIERAARIIRRGGLVAFPTETVYGLGASALDVAAIERIYRAKGRPDNNPLIVHVADAAGARGLVTEWPEVAQRLADAYWPGPLTLVLPRHRRVPARVSAGLETVAVRVPSHPVAVALIRAAGVPVVAPSANPSMAISPTRAEHVASGLGDRVDLILDGGPTGVGIESTVLDLSGARPAILRPGALTRDDLAPLVGGLADPETRSGGAPRPSPGMLDRHYAPRAAVHLFARAETANALDLARRVVEDNRTVGAMVMDIGHFRSDPAFQSELFHALETMPADPADYARELYAALHRMDDRGCEVLLVEAVPGGVAWEGVRDRLARAATEAGT